MVASQVTLSYTVFMSLREVVVMVLSLLKLFFPDLQKNFVLQPQHNHGVSQIQGPLL